MVKQKREFVSTLNILFAITTIEGIISLIWYLIMPSDPKTVWLFGYSSYRILLILLTFAGTLIFAGFWVHSKRHPGWTKYITGSITNVFSRSKRVEFFWNLNLIILFLLVTALWLALKEHWTIWVLPQLYLLGDYLSRISPLLLWFVLLCVQSLILFWLLGFRIRLRLRILQVIALMIFPGMLLFTRFLHPNFYVVITREDYLVEWLTVIFLCGAAVFAILHAIITKRKSRPHVWFLLLFAVACIFFAIEEIRWGQRLFGLESPEYFLEHSDQQEINLHNVINEQFSIRTKHLAAIGLLGFGIVIPLFALSPQIRLWADKIGILVSAKILIPGYALASLMTWDRYFNGQDEEVAEFFFSTLLFFSLVFSLWTLLKNHNVKEKIEGT